LRLRIDGMRTIPLRGIRWLAVLLPLGLTVACGGRPTADVSTPQAVLAAPTGSSTTPAPMPKNPAPRPAPDVPDVPDVPDKIPPGALANAAKSTEPGTTLGAVVFDRTTGETVLALDADRPFRSASLVKLLIAIDTLQRGTGGEDRQRVARMLAMSDDGLASALWVAGGGPELVTRTSAALGLTGVRPPEVPGQWGEVVVTPRDVVTVYRHVLALPPADRELIVGALGRAPRYAADGFDQYFGIPDGLSASWAIKQGWGNNSTSMVLHSTGLVGPGLRYVVVLLTEHPLGSGWQTSAQSVTAAATALRGLLPGA
jgi:hypothetical protein